MKTKDLKNLADNQTHNKIEEAEKQIQEILKKDNLIQVPVTTIVGGEVIQSIQIIQGKSNIIT